MWNPFSLISYGSSSNVETVSPVSNNDMDKIEK